MKIINPQNCNFIIANPADCDHARGIQPVTICEDTDGKIIGVRIKTYDEDFVLALHDLKDDEGKAKQYKWDDMMAAIKADEFDTFTRKQWGIVSVYIHEVNSKLEEAGGDNLTNGWYWSRDGMDSVPYPDGEYYGSTAWFFNGSYGALGYFNKCCCCHVRPVLALF